MPDHMMIFIVIGMFCLHILVEKCQKNLFNDKVLAKIKNKKDEIKIAMIVAFFEAIKRINVCVMLYIILAYSHKLIGPIIFR